MSPIKKRHQGRRGSASRLEFRQSHFEIGPSPLSIELNWPLACNEGGMQNTAAKHQQHPRFEEHTKASRLMGQDDFINALQTIKTCFQNHQHHILPLIDMASCYYMLNDFYNFKKWTLKAESEFYQNQNLFSPQTLSQATLGLGKLFEELGFVSEALSLYRQLLANHQADGDRLNLHSSFYRIEAQHLRLLAEMNLLNEIPAAYLRCEQYKFQDQDIENEMQNALMVCDFHLTGLESAKTRLNRILCHPKLAESEARLVIFNLLFEMMRTGLGKKTLLDAQLNQLDYFKLDEFEKCLFDLWSTNQGLVPSETLSLTRTEKLSIMSGLRYLLILTQIGPSQIKQEAEKKLFLVLQGLSSVSKNLIIKQWALGNLDQNVVLTVRESSVSCEELTIPCTENLILLMKMFKSQRVVPVADCIEKIYGIESDLVAMDRLRAQIKRINAKFKLSLSVAALFQFTKKGINLNPKVTLVFNNEGQK